MAKILSVLFGLNFHTWKCASVKIPCMHARQIYWHTGLPVFKARQINVTLFIGRENWLCCQSGQSYAAALGGWILLLVQTGGQKRSDGRSALASWPEMYWPKTLRSLLQLVFWRRMAWFEIVSGFALSECIELLLVLYRIRLNLIFLTSSSTLLLSTSGKKKFSLHLQRENENWEKKWKPENKEKEMEAWIGRNSRFLSGEGNQEILIHLSLKLRASGWVTSRDHSGRLLGRKKQA